MSTLAITREETEIMFLSRGHFGFAVQFILHVNKER